MLEVSLRCKLPCMFRRLKVLLLGWLNLNGWVSLSSRVLGTLPHLGGIGMNMGSKLGLHWTIPCVWEVLEGNLIVGVLFRVGCVISWLLGFWGHMLNGSTSKGCDASVWSLSNVCQNLLLFFGLGWSFGCVCTSENKGWYNSFGLWTTCVLVSSSMIYKDVDAMKKCQNWLSISQMCI